MKLHTNSIVCYAIDEISKASLYREWIVLITRRVPTCRPVTRPDIN